MTTDDAQVVSYTIRELFERVDEKLISIDHKLDHKADQSDLDALRLVVAGQDSALLDFKLWRAKLVGLVIGLGLGSGAIGAGIGRVLFG